MNWDHPDEVNGVLERYMLYVSEQPADIGDALYNSTNLFLYYVLTNLTAGTTYFVRVAVSDIYDT